MSTTDQPIAPLATPVPELEDPYNDNLGYLVRTAEGYDYGRTLTGLAAVAAAQPLKGTALQWGRRRELPTGPVMWHRIWPEVVIPHGWLEVDLDNIITGSGCTAYDWWHSLTTNTDGTYTAVVDNPDDNPDDGESRTVTFPAALFADLCQRIIDREVPVAERIRKYIDQDDLDADAVDVVLQIICFGQIIYS